MKAYQNERNQKGKSNFVILKIKKKGTNSPVPFSVLGYW